MNAMTKSAFDVSRRRFLAGAGGLSFCVALEANGFPLVPQGAALSAPGPAGGGGGGGPAGAQVRKVLLANAAEKGGVDAASLRTEPGVVVDPASGRRLGYGKIAAFAKVPSTLPAITPGELKPQNQFRLIGKDVPRRDIPLKVNGAAQFAIDVDLPGMEYAGALHSPVQGGEPGSWNDAEVKALRGVLGTVRLADGGAGGATRLEAPMGGRARLKGGVEKGA